MTSVDLTKILKEINDDDKKTMFGSTITSVIEKSPFVKEKLESYLNYECPVFIGDIIEYDGKVYTVTCAYTDNSVDILGEDANKKNVGLYMKDVKIVGELQVIKED